MMGSPSGLLCRLAARAEDDVALLVLRPQVPGSPTAPGGPRAPRAV